MLLQTQSTWNEKSVRNILFWCSITNNKIILVIRKKYSLKLTFQTQDLVVLICNYLCRKSVLFQDLKPHRDLLFHWYPWDEGRLPLSRKRVQERVMDRLMEAPMNARRFEINFYSSYNLKGNIVILCYSSTTNVTTIPGTFQIVDQIP